MPAGPWRDRPAARAAALPRRSALPLVDDAVATPEIAVDVTTEHGNVPFVAFDHSLVNATAYPSKRWMAWASRWGERRLPSAPPGSAGDERSQHMISRSNYDASC